jgi:hypothetical protein
MVPNRLSVISAYSVDGDRYHSNIREENVCFHVEKAGCGDELIINRIVTVKELGEFWNDLEKR